VRRGDPHVVRVWKEEHVTCFVGLEHSVKHRGFVVDEGDGPVAGSGKGAQPLDLRGDGVTLVALLVHVEQVVVELDPHVSPQRVQRVCRRATARGGSC
jgi:hypothetical protein